MADTAVAITAGTGTNIDTRTEATNGNHRQVIVIGDPATNAGVAPVDATNGLAVYNVQAITTTATLAAETTKNIGTVRIGDGTDTAAVMPASTAPVATDTALVVAISPNTQNANGQTTMANSTPTVLSSDFVGTSGFMKKEDVASADGDAGIAAMAVRKATPANTSGADGDYEMLQMSAGRLWSSTTLEATEVHVGEVGGKSAVVAVTLSTDTSAYASGDLIADTQQIDAFFRKADGTGVINSINIIDEDAQGVALYIVFMSTSTSLGTENSAPNISDANLTAGFQGIVSVATGDYVTISGTKVATIKNIGLPVKAVSGTDDIYIAVLNATGTPTFTAAGLEMRIGVLLD